MTALIAGPGDPPNVPWGTNGPCAWPASATATVDTQAGPLAPAADTECFPVAVDPALIGYVAVTPANLGLDDDLVAHALHALGQFGDLTHREARILLDKWSRRDLLTDGQVTEVLAYYPPALKAAA